MVTVRRGVGAALAVAALAAGAWTTSSGAAVARGSVAGNVEPALDSIGRRTVGVVAAGAPVEGGVALIVRNRMPFAVTRVRVTATARHPGSRGAARAGTRQVVPAVLAPGALGLARVAFPERALPAGADYRFEVDWERAREPRAVVLEPTGFRLSPPSPGPVAQSLGVTIRNPTRHRLRGPVRVAVMCFGEARRPVTLVATTVRTAHLAPRATVDTHVEFRDLCPSYLVGANATVRRSSR